MSLPGFRDENRLLEVGHMYPNIVRVWKAITYNTAKGVPWHWSNFMEQIGEQWKCES